MPPQQAPSLKLGKRVVEALRDATVGARCLHGSNRDELRLRRTPSGRLQLKPVAATLVHSDDVGDASADTQTFQHRRLDGSAVAAIGGMERKQIWRSTHA